MEFKSSAATAPQEKTPRPSEIILHQSSGVLELVFPESPAQAETRHQLSAEYLRINSPSAEVQGHSPNERVLVSGKIGVRISALHPVGNYAILLEFSDGHRTGIYSFGYLHQLGLEHGTRWSTYLQELAAAGKTREV
jgi:DUF971 family protein